MLFVPQDDCTAHEAPSDVLCCPCSVDSENHPATLTFTSEAANSSLLSAVSSRVIENLSKEPIAFHNHGFGELTQQYGPQRRGRN